MTPFILTVTLPPKTTIYRFQMTWVQVFLQFFWRVILTNGFRIRKVHEKAQRKLITSYTLGFSTTKNIFDFFSHGWFFEDPKNGIQMTSFIDLWFLKNRRFWHFPDLWVDWRVVWSCKSYRSTPLVFLNTKQMQKIIFDWPITIFWAEKHFPWRFEKSFFWTSKTSIGVWFSKNRRFCNFPEL